MFAINSFSYSPRLIVFTILNSTDIGVQRFKPWLLSEIEVTLAPPTPISKFESN